MGGETPPPSIFKIALQNYFTPIPSDSGLGTENPRSLGIKAILSIIRILIFFKIASFTASLCGKFLFLIIKSQILHAVRNETSVSRLSTVAQPILGPF